MSPDDMFDTLTRLLIKQNDRMKLEIERLQSEVERLKSEIERLKVEKANANRS
jgi:hypothetical protein